jgi:BlaI family transcriptional regulator, penicillinase repressor
MIGLMNLTTAEEQIMKILWKIKKGFVRDIVKEYEDPKPAYTTVATTVKILEKKGFVAFNQVGNIYEYYPIISEKEYTSGFLKKFVSKYFSDSFKNMISAFSEEEELSPKEIEEIIAHFQQLKSKKEQ